MELRHLRYLLAVAEERHFGRAAERLHMAQPPLSQQIRQLEAELGVTLLDRNTRRVELTAAGAAYLELVRAILAEVDDAATRAQRVAAGSPGRCSARRRGPGPRGDPASARPAHRRAPGGPPWPRADGSGSTTCGTRTWSSTPRADGR